MDRHSRIGFRGVLAALRLREDEAQDLAEYGMLAALIAVVAIVALAALGGTLASLWGNITAAFAGLP
jgi:Flp pilus assembly pilin Flp